jgi:hypothetical protein
MGWDVPLGESVKHYDQHASIVDVGLSNSMEHD